MFFRYMSGVGEKRFQVGISKSKISHKQIQVFSFQNDSLQTFTKMDKVD